MLDSYRGPREGRGKNNGARYRPVLFLLEGSGYNYFIARPEDWMKTRAAVGPTRLGHAPGSSRKVDRIEGPRAGEVARRRGSPAPRAWCHKRRVHPLRAPESRRHVSRHPSGPRGAVRSPSDVGAGVTAVKKGGPRHPALTTPNAASGKFCPDKPAKTKPVARPFRRQPGQGSHAHGTPARCQGIRQKGMG